MPSIAKISAIVTILPLLFLTAASAQLPPNTLLSRFEPDGDFVFELDGEVLDDVGVFNCRKAAAFLIMPTAAEESLQPLLVSTGEKKIYGLDTTKVFARDNGRVDVLGDAPAGEIASYGILEQLVYWSMPAGEDGKVDAKLRPRPWLLGEQDADGMCSNPAYAYKAQGYEPNADALEALKAVDQDVRMVVYFGSWCPFCKQNVPWSVRLAQELAETKIGVEFYGLPRPATDDPESTRAKIDAVPTAVVYVDGKEKGRLDGNDLKVPEKALKKLLVGS